MIQKLRDRIADHGSIVTVSNIEMSELVLELQAANEELRGAVSQGLLEGQRPLLRVLKVELLGQIKEVGEHVRQLRWLLREIMENEYNEDLAETLRVLRERGGATFFEHVEAIVSAKLSSRKTDSNS